MSPRVRCGRRRAVEQAFGDLTMIQLRTKRAIPFIAVICAVAGRTQIGLISRGRELTEQVAKCQNCHTLMTRKRLSLI